MLTKQIFLLILSSLFMFSSSFICKTGEYYNTYGRRCMPCDKSCLGCTGPTPQMCNSCKLGYYLTSGSCKSCDNSCLYCTIKADYCLSCNAGYTFDYRSNSGRCISAKQCRLGTYLEPRSNSCAPCDASCEGCKGYGNNACSSCKPGQYIINSYTSSFCTNCNESCLTCYGNGPKACSSCREGYTLNSGQCISTKKCNLGSYLYPSTNICYPCDNSCEGCYGPGPNSCDSCKPGKFLIRSYTSASCFDCHSSCLTCTGNEANSCTSCRDGFELKLGACVSSAKCAVGTYLNTYSNSCNSCDYSCYSCTGPTPKDCISCKLGRYLNSSTRTCDFCNGTCGTCYQKDFCTSCDTGYTLNAATGVCTKSPPPPPPKIIDTSVNVKCKSGSFYDSASQKCVSCNYPCQECTGKGPESCKSCQQGLYFDQPSQSCQLCHFFCRTCDKGGINGCTSCLDRYYMTYGECKYYG